MSAGVVKGARIAEVAFVATVVLLVASIAIPSFHTLQKRARRSEAKQNLHDIQLYVESFAVDTEGSYPQYLIGGSAGYRDSSAPPGKANAAPVTLCKQNHLSDPLLRKGYLTAYPRNPFARDGLLVHATQKNLTTSITGNDPLRNGSPEGKLLGTRFGPDCNLMGSVLCDPRFEKWTCKDKATGTFERLDTWANIEYPYWDAWTPGHFRPFLPGEFFYKGVGPVVAVRVDANASLSGPHTEHLSPRDEQNPYAAAVLPSEIDTYMLGLYGAITDKGLDVLGPEKVLQLHAAFDKASGTYLLPVYQQTSSQCGGGREGSPFRTAVPEETNEQLSYGNPNGIRDGIVLVLTAGKDYVGGGR